MTIFEQEASKTEAGRNYELDNENALEWITGDKIATVTLSQKRLIFRVGEAGTGAPGGGTDRSQKPNFHCGASSSGLYQTAAAARNERGTG